MRRADLKKRVAALTALREEALRAGVIEAADAYGWTIIGLQIERLDIIIAAGKPPCTSSSSAQ